MLKTLKENRENVAKKNELHKLVEEEENAVVSIMDKAKKKMYKTRIHKEIKVILFIQINSLEMAWYSI